MHISKLTIRNYRNFRNATFMFCKGVNTLIGENGSGKTNAFYAIRLLIDDSLSRRAIQLRESDFNRSLGYWKGHWIIISLDFEELDTSEGCQIIRHNAGHMTDQYTGTYTYIYRPKKEIRKKLFDNSTADDPENKIEEIVDSITIDDYECIFTGKATADFSDDDLYKAIVGNFEDKSFPDPDEEDSSVIGVKVPNLHYEVSCTFAKALRDVISDLKGYRDNPLLGLLRGTDKKIEVAEANKIIEAVSSLNNDISELDEITRISKGIQTKLYTTVGYTYSPSIGIKSALPEDLDKLLQRLSLRVGDALDGDYQGDLTELSLGAANLIFLSLKLLEYEFKIASDRVAHFLLIEEPEAHIHTHIQMTLFEKYGYEKTQVIVSTHSTHLSSSSKIRSVNILSKGYQEAHVYQPSVGLEEAECERIERYLDAVRSTLLFAKGVMVVEGDAEMILIPSMVREVFGISLDELGVSLINMGSTVFKNIAKIFHEMRVRRNCAIITDLDESIYELPKDADDDDDDQKKSRDSQVAGEQRKEKLRSFCDGNNYVNAFFADHTFEVDFIRNDNAYEIVNTLEDIYSRQADIIRSTQQLESDHLAVSGKEVLRLAEKVGKGWFALMIAENVSSRTYIPDYILKALAFACSDTIDDSTIRAMGLYRINKERMGDDFKPVFANISTLKKLPSDEFIKQYRHRLPDDQLTRLIKLLEDVRNDN
ncbi:MAG: AAA family ATPase [Proteobacteria bacterium]|nr:AAA family ATPase [Pseudomonadota bacterium]